MIDTAPNWIPAWSRAEGASRTTKLFQTAFGYPPSGVWSAPGRVNIIGEHTDYNGGVCLPIALPHRTYVALAPRDDGIIRLRSAQTDLLWECPLAAVAPEETEGWGAYVAGVAWALAQEGYSVGGFDAAIDSCVPFGASLSSSAALETATAYALSDVFNLGLTATDAGLTVLVDACRRAENDIAGAPTGGLDQSASLFAGVGQTLALDFDHPGHFATRIPFDLAAHNLTLLVVDSKAPHQLNDGQYANRRESCEQATAILGVPNLRKVSPARLDGALATLAAADPTGTLTKRTHHVVTEIDRAQQFIEIARDYFGGVEPHQPLSPEVRARVGQLMNDSHDSLRDDYEVTVPETDLAVQAARAAGAVGARMTGGGFGGSIIALIDDNRVADTAAAIAAAFADASFAPPAFLLAPPSAPAARDA